jgi:hypothetical protein
MTRININKFKAKRRAAGLCIFCRKPPRPAIPGKCYCELHKELGKIRSKAAGRKRRRKVLDHYGRECYCCGETNEVFLQIDHIDGGGNEHRRIIGQGGLYAYLIKNDFPSGYRTACAICNWGRSQSKDGQCPHVHYPKKARDELQSMHSKHNKFANKETSESAST